MSDTYYTYGEREAFKDGLHAGELSARWGVSLPCGWNGNSEIEQRCHAAWQSGFARGVELGTRVAKVDAERERFDRDVRQEALELMVQQTAIMQQVATTLKAMCETYQARGGLR